VNVGKLSLDPSRCPAVLDTTTWDRPAALAGVKSMAMSSWASVARGLASHPDPWTRPSDVREPAPCRVHPGSHARWHGADIALASLEDGQDVFVAFSRHGPPAALGAALGSIALADGLRMSVHPTDMSVLARYLRECNPEKAPRAMGTVPRIGIGDRHTVAVWPAAFRAMERGGFAANAIQNSLRELNLLEDLKQGRPSRENYLFGFGRIAEGHTGSTFEGLLHAGVIAALKAPTLPRYGADADHIQVKRGPDGLQRARRVMDASRHYTFFTLDVSDILSYDAMKTPGDVEARALLAQAVRDPGIQRDLLAYHRRERTVDGRRYAFGEAEVGKFAGKYWAALAGVEELCAHLRSLKGTTPFDVELSIDENPPEVPTAECLTTAEEMVFLAVEMQRRHLPVTHIAPNFGVEKGTDYRGSDGRHGLEARVRTLSRIAEAYGLMLDCHSGDDLEKETRQVFGRASGGRINFKVSPRLQLLFAETLYDVQRDLFLYWWNDVRAFVAEEAQRGSAFAAACMKKAEADPEPRPDADLFHYYCFVSVGRRDGNGRFVNRERLYDVSPQCREEYGARLEKWLLEIADDLYGQGGRVNPS